ncbi:type I methionyl aminopeptidase [Desulforhopalus sp. IMCC35007]|uniref:type I methionyl aminopeptidase n=1 Tax=Desulforhopalus sp. IMCC35007 TaxID=2569543 RepID=UPI0010AE31CF|nr:type I methionyl aminopeptidase [Desulforhopalus sp. IMCC35007]TKB08373.1 type I methionyl aminopeptidase [Desulforhopalus sp. IMCC35007]
MTIIGRNDLCWCNSGKKYKKCHLRSDERGETSPPGVVAKTRTPTVLPGGVSPSLTVPREIGRPEYAESGRPTEKKMSCKKSNKDQIERMRHAGRVAREVLDTVLAAVKPGITTDELDKIAHARTIALGAYPSPLNYMGFPKSICTSANEVVVHGIPDGRKLVNGDIINCDITVFAEGMHGDCSETVFVGNVDEDSQKLVRVTWECLMKGIDVVRPGELFNSIGRVIEQHATESGFSVVREFTGHGIGQYFHMAPYIAHFYEPGNKMLIEEGMTFTIEPMINAGSAECLFWNDKWTAVTKDLARSAQFEHTILVTADGAEILTGGREPFFLK